ncbi:DUF1269 domain-containing protein [Paracoccus sp. p4-l81]|uniref:DUF1269 domain-containing protein n=1 Tax=unclassified Paracoccus (in: a-proteobacteria) TaxID=2688777 RepID=UPI0035B7F769
MSDLIAIAFDDEATAFQMRDELIALQKEYLLEMEDVVVVTRPEGEVKLHQAVNTTAMGAVGGTVWGALIGLIFLNPILGAAVGAGAGALSGYATDIGINDDFMREAGQSLQPGGGAVFVLLRKMTADRVLDRFESLHKRGRVLKTSLSGDDEAKLRAAFDHVAGEQLATGDHPLVGASVLNAHRGPQSEG